MEWRSRDGSGIEREAKKMDSLENKIAALEREQLSIRKYLQENIESNKELVEIVKELCSNIEKLEAIDTNGTE
nr:MAG TPA: hypothetical protein [Caudoviricetes sp.]